MTHISVTIGSDNRLLPCRGPLHYLNQCWNIGNSKLRNHFQGHVKHSSHIFVHENAFENVWKIETIFSQTQCVNVLLNPEYSRPIPWLRISSHRQGYIDDDDINSLRPRRNGRYNADDSAFFRKKMFEFRLKFHWSLFLRVQISIFQHWFRYWLGADQATSHYLNQWWLVYWRIYASLGVNELTMPDLHTLVCHDEGFKLSKPTSQCW